jgi:hypothetical protein
MMRVVFDILLKELRMNKCLSLIKNWGIYTSVEAGRVRVTSRRIYKHLFVILSYYIPIASSHLKIMGSLR